MDVVTHHRVSWVLGVQCMVHVEAMVAIAFIVSVLWVFWKNYKALLDAVNSKGGLWWMI